MARRHWVCVFAFVLALVAQPVAPRAQQQTPGARAAIAVRTATADGVSVQYLSAGSGPADRTSARLRRNVAHVAAIDTAPGGDAHRDCTRSARDRRIRDSSRRPGHDTRRRPHACAREKPRCEQGGRRRTRHRIDGRLRVRRAVPRRRRQARAHGRVSARRRRLGGDLQRSGDLALPLQRAHAGGHCSRS